jgi:copper chaperone
MTCGHCVISITKAIHSVDRGAKVDVDLPERLVRIEWSKGASDELLDVIAAAGYTPVPVSAERAPATALSTQHRGCCGCCS